ncbi:tyrosine--tRNA ligase [Buchnera aphidicola]|uniref:tyrosine--tRNA ligase n=1 Tax=Buchnera aphidicola TaxID=9 RepID=UPI0031B811D2
MSIVNILDELKERGFVFYVSNFDHLKKNILSTPITVYCGFDPTADSLHVGHLLPLLCLMWFQKYGHKIIIVIGNATSLIGDPSFKLEERKFQEPRNIIKWSKEIKKQIYNIFSINNCQKPIILNNYDWFKNMTMITFLRDIGKFFSVNKMISRKSVRKRINRTDHGISFTEFSYNLLQSYDFLQLHKNYKVVLQIGGSDQWGNISSGIELIQRIYKKQVFGLTVPLLLKKNGDKFGKSDHQSMVWLNITKTSPYKFYQFWLNIHDDLVYSFLNLFTFLSRFEIKSIQDNSYDINKIKVILASKITEIVHGKHALQSAERITSNLFFGNVKDLKESDFLQLQQDGIFCIDILSNIDFKQILVDSKLSVSRSHAHQLIIAGAIKINSRKEIDPGYKFVDSDRIFSKYTILSKGKKNHCLLCW